jgi:hypothetical protein
LKSMPSYMGGSQKTNLRDNTKLYTSLNLEEIEQHGESLYP